MGSEWETVTLGDISKIIMGQSPKGDTCNNERIGSPLLNGPTEFGGYHPYPIQYTLDPKKHSQQGDLLFCVRGSTTGRMNWSDQEYAIGRGLAAIRHKKGWEYQPFLRGIVDLKLPELLTLATGSTFPNISRKQLVGLEVCIPKLQEQKAIAHVLGSLDERIELNRQMNETLEALAEALFKSWFVDFDPVIDNALAAGKEIPEERRERAQARSALGDKRKPLPPEIRNLFPDEFTYTDELGWIPLGWEVGKMSDHAFINMGQSPKGDTYNTVGEGVPLVNGPVEFGEYFTKKAKWTTAPTKMAESDDLIICVRGSTIGRFVKSDGEYCLGRGVCNFRAKKSQQFVDQLYKHNSAKMRAYTTGSTFPNWSRQTLASFPVIKPHDTVLVRFNDLTSEIVARQKTAFLQKDTLGKLRDTLLPKLLSGELRIPAAEKLVEEAAA